MPDQRFETVKALPPVCQKGLRNLLLAISDTKLLLGYHYGEWTFGPPELEAAVACCSLCQSELGHVRLLHALLNKHYKDDPDQLVESRKSAEFANITYLNKEIKDWAKFVAANYVVDLAITSLLHSMKNSAFKPLHMSLDKMLEEERYHIHHGQGWFRTLAQKNDETRQAISESTYEALRSVTEWFGPESDEEDKALVEADIKADLNTEILGKFTRELVTLADKLELDLNDEEEMLWDGWRPETRRISGDGPDEQILYHLKGKKNKVFKLGA